MFYRGIVLVLAVLIVAFSPLLAQAKVLFLGNSYVGTNNLPQVFENLALSLGDTVYTDRNTPGGYTLQGHSTNASSLSKITSEDWDFVILQEQSQRPSFPIAQVMSDVFPYAALLVDSIHANSSCTEAVFYMTWGRENGDASNCANWPPVCTYNGMQALLRERYLQMAYDNNAWASPVGVAWKNIRDTYPNIDLYSADGSHPSFAGTYLAACSFYSTLFGKPTTGASYIGNLSANDAANIQQISSQTVLDSLSTWNIGINNPEANFSATYLGSGNWQFSDLSSGQNLNYLWMFDMANPQTQASPTVQLSGTDSIEVTLWVTDDCGRKDSLTNYISSVGTHVPLLSENKEAELAAHGSQLVLTTTRNVSVNIALYDLSGKLLETIRGNFDTGSHAIGSFNHDAIIYNVSGDLSFSGRLIGH